MHIISLESLYFISAVTVLRGQHTGSFSWEQIFPSWLSGNMLINPDWHDGGSLRWVR